MFTEAFSVGWGQSTAILGYVVGFFFPFALAVFLIILTMFLVLSIPVLWAELKERKNKKVSLEKK